MVLRKAELLIWRPPRGIGEINFLLLLYLLEREERKDNLPITAGWRPKKQFCFSKPVPFRILSPIASYGTIFAAKWSSNGGLEVWFQSNLLKVTKVRLLTVALFVLIFSAKCVIFLSLTIPLS